MFKNKIIFWGGEGGLGSSKKDDVIIDWSLTSDLFAELDYQWLASSWLWTPRTLSTHLLPLLSRELSCKALLFTRMVGVDNVSGVDIIDDVGL